jgi:AraC family transcriptional regulator of arabinose operon
LGAASDHRWSGLVRIGDLLHPSAPGDSWLFAPDAAHDYDRDPKADSWTHHWIFFHPRAHWIPWLGRWQVRGPGIGHLPIGLAFAEAFHLVQTASLTGGALADAQAMHASEGLLLAILDSIGPPPSETPLVQAAKGLIASRFTEDLSVGDIARAVGCSASHLAHRFKQELGQGPIAFRDNLRMQRAAELLRTTGMPVATIAAEIGYADPLYFSRVFRKQRGESPTSFRHGPE